MNSQTQSDRGAVKSLISLGMMLFVVLAFVPQCVSATDPGSLTVKVDQPGVKISPMLYGLMTEEINYSYDGGLYGELIQNRILKDAKTPVHWSLVNSGDAQGSMALDDTDPVNTTVLTTSLRLNITAASTGQRVGIANDGFWGIPVKPGTEYRASFYAKGNAGFPGPLTVDIESNDGRTILATASVPMIDAKWQQYTVPLKTGQITPSSNNRFVISAANIGSVSLNLVSLFAPAYKNRSNGNRIDLMEKLGDMQPAFLRLPGGNYLEGNTIAERFDWKKTVHGLDQRPGHQGPWGYRSSDGLGLLEFLEWCEDLKTEPVLAVFAGYALQGQRVASGPALQPFVQDALDEIEYVIGDKNTKWGQERTKDGHPEPFKLTYVEVGNEDNFDRGPGSYDGRFTQFYDAIRGTYPKLQIIATAPVRTRRPDVIDDHYYRSAREMALDSNHYDRYDRNGPKIFVGEWASMEGAPTPTLNAALGDAAWLTGLERNSDLVVMSCYAPLLVNVNPNARQWRTNLIGYDAMNSFGSPSYYTQKMFNQNRGDTVLPVSITAQVVPDLSAQALPRGAIGVGTWATDAEYKDIKIVKGDTVLYQSDFSKGIADWKVSNGEWKVDDGALRQVSNNTDCHVTAGDARWGDYIFTAKARKLSGSEGFMFLFHVKDPDNYIWWNVGGWNNTRTALEFSENGAKSELGQASNLGVESNRWYDIRIELKGRDIKCFLDDKLITQATQSDLAPVKTMFAAASRDDASGDVIVKVVNPFGMAEQLQIMLQGVNTVKGATAGVLSGQPGDVNTIQEPQKVVPRWSTVKDTSPRFIYEFPAYSISVLRFKL